MNGGGRRAPKMIELNQLILAVLAFVGGHFLLSSRAMRENLVERLGNGGFRIAYSAVAAATLAWIVLAYKNAPYIEVWSPPAFFSHIMLVIMPVAVFLVVAGVTTRSPTAVGGDQFDQPDPNVPNSGILRVTRHPFLWGVALWALAHLLVNGDAAAIILLIGMLILCLGGMAHIDARRAASMGPAWGPIQMTTSAIPFAALLSGRTSMDWAGIGWWRPLLALVVFLALLLSHRWVIGVSPLPMAGV
jgi:uncharacterized membrane protein